MFWSVGWPLLWAGGFFCNLDILYGGLLIGKLQFLIQKTFNFFSNVIFFEFLVIKALDPDPYWPPSGSSGSGSVSVKNEYGSETLLAALCFTDFIDWRYVHSRLVFSTQLVYCCPSTVSSLLPPPSQTKCTVYTVQSVCGYGRGGGVLSCV